jgi:disulfide oxidoreductase YuzD
LLNIFSALKKNQILEHVLGFKSRLNDIDKIYTDPFLLPVQKLREKLLAEGNTEALKALDTDVDLMLEVELRRRLSLDGEQRMLEEANKIESDEHLYLKTDDERRKAVK